MLAAFDDVAKAGQAVANIIAAGIIPAGLEMMDKITTGAVEAFVHAGYPLDAEAILLCESDGTQRRSRRRNRAHASGDAAERRHRSARVAKRSRAHPLLGRAQGGVPGGGARVARLLLHGRHHPASARCRTC